MAAAYVLSPNVEVEEGWEMPALEIGLTHEPKLRSAQCLASHGYYTVQLKALGSRG